MARFNIETYYNGNFFHSRLEARWAYFFKTLGIHYRYEGYGYQLGPRPFIVRADGETHWEREDFDAEQAAYGRLPYIPDFWLSDYDTWLEIKPKRPSDLEREKMWRLAVHTKKSGVIFSLAPWEGAATRDARYGVLFSPDAIRPAFSVFAECGACGALVLANLGAETTPCCGTPRHDALYHTQTDRIKAAAQAARTARFDDLLRVLFS